MKKRDRITEINEIKERGHGYAAYIATKLDDLRRDWERVVTTDKKVPDFYAIRAVTILEVFTRRHISSLVDHDKKYAQRAALLLKDYKIDFDILQGIQGRAITLGDIVSHSIPVSSFGQILNHFKILLDKPIAPMLRSAVDRWRTEVEKLPAEPIIPDYNRMSRCVTSLFEVRHILCHEIPSKPPYSIDDISDFLTESRRLTKALGEVLNLEMYGRTPLTQKEMNIDAFNKLKIQEEKLQALVDVVLKDRNTKNEEIELIKDSQEKWIAYRNVWCDLETWRNKGGTIRPLLWATRAQALTQLRLEEFDRWVQWRLKP